MQVGCDTASHSLHLGVGRGSLELELFSEEEAVEFSTELSFTEELSSTELSTEESALLVKEEFAELSTELSVEFSTELSLAEIGEELVLFSKEEVELSTELSTELSLAEEAAELFVELSTKLSLTEEVELSVEEEEPGILQAAIVAIVRVAAKANSNVVVFLIFFIINSF